MTVRQDKDSHCGRGKRGREHGQRQHGEGPRRRRDREVDGSRGVKCEQVQLTERGGGTVKGL